MRTPSEDYRWQDHVPSVGAADVAAGVVIAAALWLAVAIQLPADGSAAKAARVAAPPLATVPVSARSGAVPVAAGCGSGQGVAGPSHPAAGRVDA